MANESPSGKIQPLDKVCESAHLRGRGRDAESRGVTTIFNHYVAGNERRGTGSCIRGDTTVGKQRCLRSRVGMHNSAVVDTTISMRLGSIHPI